MPISIELADLGQYLDEMTRKYGALVQEEAEAALEEQANRCLSELPGQTPIGQHSGSRHLARSWSLTKIGSGGSVTFHIWARKWHRYSVVHLVENGHLSKNQYGGPFKGGKKTKANSFLNAIQTKYSISAPEAVKKAVAGAAKKL